MLCSSTANCTAYEWTYLNNTRGRLPSSCYLASGTPNVKKPVHPSQSDCVISTPPPPPPLPPAPPGAISVLYILVDDLRTQLSPYNHMQMHTPNIEKFASESIVFTQAHCNSQMCVPTRNSFMVSVPSYIARAF